MKIEIGSDVTTEVEALLKEWISDKSQINFANRCKEKTMYKSRGVEFARLNEGTTFTFDGKGYKKREGKAECLTHFQIELTDIAPDARVFVAEFVKILGNRCFHGEIDERFIGRVFPIQRDCYNSRYVSIQVGRTVDRVFIDHLHYADLSSDHWTKFCRVGVPYYDRHSRSVVVEVTLTRHQGISPPSAAELQAYVCSKVLEDNFELEDRWFPRVDVEAYLFKQSSLNSMFRIQAVS